MKQRCTLRVLGRLMAILAAAIFSLFTCILPIWAETTAPAAPTQTTTNPYPVDGTTVAPPEESLTVPEESDPYGESTEPTEPPPETDENGETRPPPPSIVTEPPTTTTTTTRATTTVTTTKSTTTALTNRPITYTGVRVPHRDVPDFYEWITTPDGESYTVLVEAPEDYTPEDAQQSDSTDNRTRTIITIAAGVALLAALVVILLLARKRPEEDDPGEAEAPVFSAPTEPFYVEIPAEEEPVAEEPTPEEPLLEEPTPEETVQEDPPPPVEGSFAEDLEKLEDLENPENPNNETTEEE
ncbi:MAG: hypothetical protein LBS96_08320 [Oscillospiraceae bacterium]|nr:hypothetical protein [Oscillospiraceae bacterium]